MRQPISQEEKIAITLKLLARGETFYSLMYQFRVQRVAISKFAPEVCKVTYHCLKDEYLMIPSTAET